MFAFYLIANTIKCLMTCDIRVYKIYAVLDPCDSVDCQNGGTCSTNDGSYICNCVDGYNGTHCENGTKSYPFQSLQINNSIHNFHSSFII